MRMPSTSLLVSIFHLLLLPSIVHSGGLCIETEKHALLDFKQSFVADRYGVLSDWSIHNGDCCKWNGVSCNDSNGHVISIDIFGLKSYKLQPSLLQLQHLTYLSFMHNEFTMKIPEFIGSLSNLTDLDLSSAGFFGKIPPHLGNLSRLENFDLSQSNGLHSDSLQWLSHLSSLETLILDNVNLSSATDWLSTLTMLPSLSEFSCSSCSLPSPPLRSISLVNSSTTFQTLDLSNNKMSSSTFSCLINSTNNLRELHLANMNLEQNLQDFLGALIRRARYSLEVLDIRGNNLKELPLEDMMFPSLMTFDASFNRISANPQEILQHLPKNLTHLDLSDNSLNGVISDEFFSYFSELELLALSYNNQLTFNFSESWAPPFYQIGLGLRSCKLGPSFPDWLLKLPLRYLDISNSMISSAIPNGAFWNSTAGIDYLNFSFNNMHGPIPPFVFNAEILDLSNNRFSGFLPYHDSLYSYAPWIINLSNNRLSGSVSNWLVQFNNLQYLSLANNMLSGTLPSAIGSLYQLIVLHLYNNRFSGQLPSSMKNCTSLRILELTNNRFSGPIPFWLGERLAQLVVLSLRSNHFSGGLPSSLCHLQNLQILDLSHNRISGSIPGCIHNFTAMGIGTDNDLNLILPTSHIPFSFEEQGFSAPLDYAFVWKGALGREYVRKLLQRNVIDFSSNCLSGEIPIEVTTLKELRSLNLSRNHLNGSIPDKIGQLKSLEVLALSSNRLSGEIPSSLASLTFLDKLNLSNNNLFGKIPTSTQLQSFDPSSYAGNPQLCGLPLPTKCPGDEEEGEKQPPFNGSHQEEDESSFDMQAFYAALGTGFAFSFLGVLGILHFITQWRLAFFGLADDIADRISMMTLLCHFKIQKRLCFQKANGAADM